MYYTPRGIRIYGLNVKLSKIVHNFYGSVTSTDIIPVIDDVGIPAPAVTTTTVAASDTVVMVVILIRVKFSIQCLLRKLDPIFDSNLYMTT